MRLYLPFLAAFALVCICAAGTYFDAGPWQIWVGIAILSVVLIAFVSIPAAIAVLIVFSPYNSLIRQVAGDSILIRGLRDLMSYVILAVFFVKFSGKSRTRAHSTVAWLFIFWCVVVQLIQFIHSGSPLIGILGLRALVGFFLFFPVLVAVLSLSENGVADAEGLLGTIVFTAGVVAVIQLANHFNLIHIPIEFSDEQETLIRNLGGNDFTRMNPIWEVSPSGLAIYLISATMIIIARFAETGKVPILWLPCLAGNLACAFLTLSHATIVSFLLGLGVISICIRRKVLGGVVLMAVTLAAMPILFGNNSFSEKNTAEYSVSFFKIWAASWASALSHPIFGTGAAPSGYLAELAQGEAHSIGDGGWAMFASQVGIPFTIVMLWWSLSILVKSGHTLIGDNSADGSKRWVLLGALSGAAVYFANAHGVPWYRVGADVNFIVLVAILTVFAVRDTPAFRKTGRFRRNRRDLAGANSLVPNIHVNKPD